MTGVQGLQYRAEDAAKSQFCPVQHEFFPSQNQPANRLPQESAPHQRFMSKWPSVSQLNDRSASDNPDWRGAWEWDSFLLAAHPTAANFLVPLTSSSNEPAANLEASSDSRMLELGLRTTAGPKDDDNLLALKLGGNSRSSAADDLPPTVKRSRHSSADNQTPRCQVDNCTADLYNAKDYHRRHKVCEFHAKAAKAPVSQMMQRFCQQCSRFHLLEEFDDDRRSCRRRLAGHNRRRRKNQPDAAAALACMLADQNALSRIVNPLGQPSAKDDLDGLLKLLGGSDTLVQSLGDAGNKSGTVNANNLIIELAKSQILRNVLCSDSNLLHNLPARASSTQRALSNAILLSLMQLQQKNDDNERNGHVLMSDRTLSKAVGDERVTKQNRHGMSDLGVQSTSLMFPGSTEQPLGEQVPVYLMCNDNSNESNGDSTNEMNSREESLQREKCTQYVTKCHNRNNGIANNVQTTKFQSLDYTESFSPEEYFDTVVGSDNSSDSGLNKQEQTFQLWFKIFDRGPADLPSSLRKQMLEWLECLPTEMEGYIRPGCIILTIFICMPVHAWNELCSDIEKRLHNLVCNPEGDFWRKGRVLVQLGDVNSFLVDGKVVSNAIIPSLIHKPSLILVQPFAVAVGEKVELTLKGCNLKSIGNKVIFSYEGNCVVRGMAYKANFQYRKRDREEVMPFSGPEEQEIFFHLGPLNNYGHGFIEVEGQLVKGNSFPIIIADRKVCDDVSILERKFSVDLGNDGTKRPNKQDSDIIHFLYEYGWLLQRSQWKLRHVDSGEFSPERYRWLLQFTVQHGCCAVVKSILDMLFYSIDNSLGPAYMQALNILSESNLLHIAVKNSSRKMVECLLTYTCPISCLTTKQRYLFRPDTPSYGGLTALHVAAGMHAAADVLDALTNTPDEFWTTAWMAAKDGAGQTPLMYAMSRGYDTYVKLVEGKLQRCAHSEAKERNGTIEARHLALSIITEDSVSSTKRAQALFTKQIQECSCRGAKMLQMHNLPIRIHGLYRPFVLSMLTVAAVCVCVGVLMKGPPSVNFIEGPFVWESIRYGAI